jgi:hypothetical protein
MHGDDVETSLFMPWARTLEPYIRIATGDYSEIRRERGRDNALAVYLHVLTLQVLHYREWVETGDSSNRGKDARATRLVEKYAKTVDRP